MTVRELIEHLEEFEERNMGMEVRFGYDYGDRAHMTIATEINSVEVRQTQPNSYLNSQYVPRDEHVKDNEVEDMVIISQYELPS